MRTDGLTDSQKYLIGAVVKIVKRLNELDDGEYKAGRMLRGLVKQLISSLCARLGQTESVAHSTYSLVVDMADFKEK